MSSKIIIIAIATMFITDIINAQTEQNIPQGKHYLGTHYLLGTCNYHNRSFGVGLSKEYDGTSYYGSGVDYRYRYSEKNELCLGIRATVNKMTSTSSHRSRSGKTGDVLYIFSLPIHFRHHFFQYFFISGGPCVNIHSNMGYNWGIGLEATAGLEHTFKSGLTLSISPMGQWNWLNFLGAEDSFSVGMDTLSQVGLNIGLGYRFGKK